MSWQGTWEGTFYCLLEREPCLSRFQPFSMASYVQSLKRFTSSVPSHLRSRCCYSETCRWGQWGLKTQARVPSVTQLGRARIWAHVWQWESEDKENITNVHEIIFSRCAPWNLRNACIGSPSTGACKIPIVIENLVTKEKPKTSTSKPMNYRAWISWETIWSALRGQVMETGCKVWAKTTTPYGWAILKVQGGTTANI